MREDMARMIKQNPDSKELNSEPESVSSHMKTWVTAACTLSMKLQKSKFAPLSQMVTQCSTREQVYLALNQRLRSFKDYVVGDLQLCISLKEASRYIQGMCDSSSDAQNSLRRSGVLNSLIDALLFFYGKHWGGQSSPIIEEKIVECWIEICTALRETVDNPPNAANQEYVVMKLKLKDEVKLDEFIKIAEKGFVKETEKYVIPIVQLFNVLPTNNTAVEAIMPLPRQQCQPSCSHSRHRASDLENGCAEVLPRKRIRLSDSEMPNGIIAQYFTLGSELSLNQKSIPRNTHCVELSAQSAIVNAADTTEIIGEKLSKIITELRPCDFVETNDHVVVFCTPGLETSSASNSDMNIDIDISSGLNDQQCASSSSQGFFGKMFTWLFG